MRAYRNFCKDIKGTILAAFAVMLPVVVGSVGMSLDLSQAYLVRQRLAGALDASALAAAAAELDEDEIRARVEEFFDTNYPDAKIGDTYDLDVDFDENVIIVSAAADFNTSFMRVLGIDKITVRTDTEVMREVQGIEVVLVMDNTGSMSTNNNIAALRTAATNFVDIMFENTSDPEDIKIGLVPFAPSVNVGPYGVGLTPEGEVYADGESFIDVGDGTFTYDGDDTDMWGGCILEGDHPTDTEDHEGLWDRYGYQRTRTEVVRECHMEWRRGRWRETCDENYIEVPYWYDPSGCPIPVTPLTNNQETLLNAIGDMRAAGNTLSNIGMVWGYRMISPEFPFEEGADWDHPMWRKAIIVMTDGDNMMGSYTAYGDDDDHDITNTNLNQRFEMVCNNLREEDVLVYTIIFTSGINDTTKGYYRRCATTESMYYYAPSQDDLISVFEGIARELSNLHIRS